MYGKYSSSMSLKSETSSVRQPVIHQETQGFWQETWKQTQGNTQLMAGQRTPP